MSAAAQTKIFGLRIGVDPRVLVGALIVLAVLVFWWNSRSEEDTGPSTSAVHRDTTAPVSAVPQRPRVALRRTATTERAGTLRLRPIDATRGDVDPTLRLDLLNRLQFVKPQEGGRNLFELGPPPMTPEQKALLANPPKVTPKPPPAAAPPAGPPPLDIPLKYYGFVRNGEKGAANRGLFLDGDNVLVASEGELVKQRYLVVELRETGARIEDVQRKQGQVLPVVPVAAQQ
ncbi:MAG: hypothetical protein JO091_10480 [Acidobacteriaceae bacterium]|nr:hypothetical protein [Acidobacteriaceae bacterium]